MCTDSPTSSCPYAGRYKQIVGRFTTHGKAQATCSYPEGSEQLNPGYGPYALNAVDSFFKVLDAYVPDEASLPLTEVISKYEHCGWVFENEGKWSDAGTKVRLEAGEEGNAASVFCKYDPADYDEKQMQLLATLEISRDASTVEDCLRGIGALTDEADGEHFHPRILRKLHSQFAVLYQQGDAHVESHQDFSQCGMTQHFVHCHLEDGSL
ncbi:unnamed protein product, partial [Symbiodinium sp. KB8]